MKREILEPFWMNAEKNQIKCIFKYETGAYEAVVSDTLEGNPDWKEIIETFGVEAIDANTQKRIDEKTLRENEHKEVLKDEEERIISENLFAAKLEAFEVPEVKNSTNRPLKSKIRKATSIMQVQAYTTALVIKELESEE